jgi:Zn-dependent peptidase ImmA (M78 family)
MAAMMVDVEPAVIDWVIQNVPNDTDVITTLYAWKNGEKTPTFNQIERISKTTHIPLGYFFLKTPPIENFPLLKYRTIQSKSAEKPSRNTIDVINQMERIQEWMRDYLIDTGYDKLSFVGSAKIGQDKQTIAQNFRDTIKITIDWHDQVNSKDEAFRFFRKRFSDIGIIVMMSGVVGNNTHRSLSIEEFRAFTLTDEYAPLIFINSNDSQGAKLFSLMHEAIHLLFGVNNFYNDRYGYTDNPAAIETICNAVAAEILMPSIIFEKDWCRLTNDWNHKIQSLAGIYHCGVVVIARKALDNKYINKEQYQEIVNEAIDQFRASRSKNAGGNYYATLITRIDNRFVIALDNSVREGKTQYTEAYRLTDTGKGAYSELVDRIRGAR